jgi:PKD repeat protein
MFSSFLSPVSCLTPGKTYYVQLDPFSSPGGSTRIVLTDIGVADASFATLNPTYCIFDTALTLAPVEAGGFFSGDGVAGFTFDPVTAGVGTHTIVYHLSSCDSTVQTVAVENVPVAAYTYSNVVNVVAFTNMSLGSNTNYWNIGDGSAPSAVTNPVHTYTANGAYTVQLLVTNGCSFDTVSNTVVISGVGIDELTAGSVSVYPNPTSGLFHVTVNNAVFSQLTISVIDLQGKEIFSTMDKNITSGYNKQINLEGISKGIYYIRLNTGTDMKVQKLIIQ